MADNIAITAGSGTTVATDDCGAGGHTQIVKLAISTDGSATLVPAEATNGLDVDVTRVIPGTTATALGKAEDAAHTTGDTGVMALSVRSDTAAATSGTDGDYQALITDASGRLHVNVGNTVTVGSHAVTNAGTFAVQVDAALPAGTNAIGKLAANSGVDIGDVDVTSITPGTTASSLGKAEDAVHSSGDVGVMALGVRNDAGTAFAADGDYVPLSVDASGAVRVTGGGGGTQYTEDAAAAADPVGTVNILVRQDTPAAITSADGDNIAQRGTDYGAAYVTLLDTGGTPVSVGGGTQYTEDAAAAANPVGNALILVREDARAGTLVSADGDNVAARGNNKGELYVKTTDSDALLTTIDSDTSALSGCVGGTELQVDIVSSALPSGASTAAKQPALGTAGTASADVITVQGIASMTPLLTTAQASTNTQEVVGDAAHDAVVAGNPVLVGGYASAAAPADVSADGDVARIWTTVKGAVNVADAGGSLTVDGTVTANLAAGTNNIGDVDVLSIAAGDNNIGNVDIVTMPNVTLAAGTNTNEVVGDAAHDAAAAGNPLPVAAIAQDMDDTAPPNQVSAEGDVVRLACDRDGGLFVHPHGPRIWSYHLDTSTAQTDTSVHAAPAAGLSLYVTDIVFSSGAATAINLFFEEGASKVLGPYYLEATAGRGMAISFKTPKKITAATALTLTTSASIAHCVDVTGFIAAG